MVVEVKDTNILFVHPVVVEIENIGIVEVDTTEAVAVNLINIDTIRATDGGCCGWEVCDIKRCRPRTS